MTDSHGTTTSDLLVFDPGALLDEGKAAVALDVSPRALQAWRQRGGGPTFVRVSSRCIRYRRRDLVAWAEARLRSSTAGAEGAEGAGDARR